MNNQAFNMYYDFFLLPYFNDLALALTWYSGIQRLNTTGLVSMPHPIANIFISQVSL